VVADWASDAAVTRLARSGTAGNGGPASTTSPPAVREFTTITLRLTVDPPVAAIAIDGARVQGTELVVPRDAAVHLMKITAAGYRDYNAFIAFDESQRLFVHLKRVTRPTRGSASQEDDAGAGSNDLIDRDSPY
jgi:hypothetical protein